MNLIFLVLTALLITCQAEKNNQTKQQNSPDSLNAAKNFRKALLEALEQLEKDETEYNNTSSDEKDDLDASDYDEDERTKYGHKIRDNISKQESVVTSFTDAGNHSVFVHSFSTNDKINSISKEKKREEPTTIKYQTKYEPDNAISASVTSTIAGTSNHLASNTKTEKNSKLLPTTTPIIPPKSALSSPSPTVTTPVEEDETKAKVEDVQFIHAPLVAAFTVEQDDKGLPHKVIPIFGNKQAPTSQFTNQNTQPSLEDRQRQLEQQIRILQEQKRQQEYIIQQQLQQRNKHFFEEQQQQHRFNIQNDINSFSQSLQEQNRLTSPHQNNIQLQQNSINFQQTSPQKNTINDQNKLKNSSQNQNILNQQQNRFNIPIPTSFRPTKDVSGTVVSFQPSISFQPNGFTPINPNINQNLQPLQQFNQNSQNQPFNQVLNQNSQQEQHQQLQQQQLQQQQQQQQQLQQEQQQQQQRQQQFNQNTQQQHFNQLQFNQQQGLPIKSAINFQKAINIPINQLENQLIHQQQQQQQAPNLFTQQQVPNQIRDNIFNNNDKFLQDFFYRQRTLVPPPRGNRVFRQEENVGNFGLNDFAQNNFQQHRFSQPINNYKFNNDIQSFRYNQFNNGLQSNFNNVNNRHNPNQFYNNHNFQNANVDNRIKNLLYQSGLGQGRSQEDLNIVSKVLALEHTGNYHQNFLFGESNNSEKRIPFNHLHRSSKT